jgi:hypothetical protein
VTGLRQVVEIGAAMVSAIAGALKEADLDKRFKQDRQPGLIHLPDPGGICRGEGQARIFVELPPDVLQQIDDFAGEDRIESRTHVMPPFADTMSVR